MAKKEKIMVVDDEPSIRKYLQTLLEVDGFQVETQGSGKEALARLGEGERPFLIILDVLMPEMDGLAAAEAICRRWPRGNRPRLIALTALAGPGDQERCIKAGFDDYMSKPVHLADLVEAFKAAAGYRTDRARPAP